MKSEPMMKLLLLMLAASCWIGPQQGVAQSRGADVRVLEHISYGIEAPQAQVLNAYLVQWGTPTAAIIQITSGGWNSAPPQRVNLEPFKPYLDAGISVIVAAHRSIGKETHWPIPGNDIARLKWDVHTPITSLILEKKLKELQVPYELVISPGGARGDTTLLQRELAFLTKHLHLATGHQSGSNPPAGETQRYSLGAKFEPPVGRVVHGIGQWEQYNAKLLPKLPADLQPASELLFVSIADKPRGWRPQGIRSTLQRYDQAGVIPQMDISLCGNQPTKAQIDKMPDRMALPWTTP